MNLLSVFSAFLLSILIVIDVGKALFCSDKSAIWSPLVFLVICILYYIYLPTIKVYSLVSPAANGYIWFGTLLYYFFFRFGFIASTPHKRFDKLNNLIPEKDSLKIATILFAICLLIYFLFNGFSLSFINSTINEGFDENGSYNHPEQYLTNLISCFCFTSCLAYIGKKTISWRVLLFSALSVIIYIICGFRFRLLLLFISFFTVYHLYPIPKRIQYRIVVPLFIALYVLVSLMEQTRSYGHGLDVVRLNAIMSGQEDIREAQENIAVYTYSAKVLEQSGIDDLLFFEPIINAALMPIPRSLFPWKPKGIYTRETSLRILGNISEGQAFCTIVEGYLSFWWFGIMLYGFLLGWLAKLFWVNYIDNKDKIGAVLLLALFNAMVYVIFSRGYLAQAFTLFVYYVFVPFWLVIFLRKIKFVK